MKQEDEQDTSLHIAACHGYTDLARQMIKKGADPTAKDEHQQTPLHLAAWGGHTAIARLLINNGADVNAIDNWQRTPLDWAVAAKASDMVALLNDAARNPAKHANRVRKHRNDDEQEQTR